MREGRSGTGVMLSCASAEHWPMSEEAWGKLEATPGSCADDEWWPHAPQCVDSAQGKMGSCRRLC